MPQRESRFIDDYLSYLLARAGHLIQQEFLAAVRAAGLTSIEWRVLAALSDGNAMTIGALAREVLAKQPTLTKLIDRMASDGLVARADHATDRRHTLVAATPAGRRLVKPLLAKAKHHEQAALASFTPRDVQALKAILRALVERAESGHRGRPSPPPSPAGKPAHRAIKRGGRPPPA